MSTEEIFLNRTPMIYALTSKIDRGDFIQSQSSVKQTPSGEVLVLFFYFETLSHFSFCAFHSLFNLHRYIPEVCLLSFLNTHGSMVLVSCVSYPKIIFRSGTHIGELLQQVKSGCLQSCSLERYEGNSAPLRQGMVTDGDVSDQGYLSTSVTFLAALKRYPRKVFQKYGKEGFLLVHGMLEIHHFGKCSVGSWRQDEEEEADGERWEACKAERKADWEGMQAGGEEWDAGMEEWKWQGKEIGMPHFICSPKVREVKCVLIFYLSWIIFRVVLPSFLKLFLS